VSRLVGSEMCIRDRNSYDRTQFPATIAALLEYGSPPTHIT
jgi:hypothetical protein